MEIPRPLIDWFLRKLVLSRNGSFGPRILNLPSGQSFYALYSEQQMIDNPMPADGGWSYWKGIQEFPLNLTVAQFMELVVELAVVKIEKGECVAFDGNGKELAWLVRGHPELVISTIRGR
jgi:hypothetical protein